MIEGVKKILDKFLFNTTGGESRMDCVVRKYAQQIDQLYEDKTQELKSDRDDWKASYEVAMDKELNGILLTDERIYPCDDCGKLRSKNEGGTTFTVCEECWTKRHQKPDEEKK